MTLYTPLFRTCTTARSLLQLHASLLVSGLHRNPLLATKLIESYAHTARIPTAARLVFDRFPSPDSFMWVAMIRAYTRFILFREAIALYHTLHHHHHHELTHFVFPPVLAACSGLRDLPTGKKLHGRISKSPASGNAAVQTSLLRLYSGAGCLEDARRVFDEMSVRDVVAWSSMVSGSVQCGQAAEGLELISKMISEGVVPDAVAMMLAANACADMGSLKQGKSVHGYMVRRLAGIDEVLENSLVTMYGECGDLDSAEKIFGNAACRSVVSWTALISCYNRRSQYREALSVFSQMQECGVDVNEVTLMSILDSCCRLGCTREGRSVHGSVVRRGSDTELSSIGSSLIKFYASFANLTNCLRVFEATQPKELIMWNSLIAAFAQNEVSDEALRLFVQMRNEGLLPDSFTLASSLPACGHIGDFCLGTQIHGLTMKSGFQLNGFVQNSLIDMYCKCGSVENAYCVFVELEGKDIVTWNSMISGFSQNSKSEESIRLFGRMRFEGIEMDEVTFLSVIQACSQLGLLGKGRWIHQNLITAGLEKDACIDTALIVMYAKCGDIEMARRVFNSISEKNVVSWSSIISGHSSYGLADDAIALFSQMVASGVRPNETTFLSVLSACSHAGLVKEGMFYFSMMTHDFGIEPHADHCACMVDLLSRAGHTDLAFNFMKSMPVEPNVSIWRALLSGHKTIVGRIQLAGFKECNG